MDKPKAGNSFTFAVWKKHNETVMKWITNSLSDEIGSVVAANEKIETARDMWLFLEEMYGLKSNDDAKLVMEFKSYCKVFEIPQGGFDLELDGSRKCLLAFEGKGRIVEQLDENDCTFKVFEFENKVSIKSESDTFEKVERRRSTRGIGWDSLLYKFNRDREIKDYSKYTFGGIVPEYIALEEEEVEVGFDEVELPSTPLSVRTQPPSPPA